MRSPGPVIAEPASAESRVRRSPVTGAAFTITVPTSSPRIARVSWPRTRPLTIRDPFEVLGVAPGVEQLAIEDVVLGQLRQELGERDPVELLAPGCFLGSRSYSPSSSLT